jgi:GNAT superfamily N-acetyltransferase
MLNYALLLCYLLYIDPEIGLECDLVTNNCSIVTTQSSMRSCNRVCNSIVPTDLEVYEIKSLFQETPFTWVVNATDSESIKILERNDLNYKGSFPAMILGLHALCSTGYNDIRVEAIDLTEHAIEAWLTIVSQSFNVSKSELSKVIDLFKRKIVLGALRLYIGYYQDKAVAAGMTIEHQDTVSVHWVGTLPEYRKRGLGFAVTHKALFDAKARGTKQAILLSSILGRSVYERLGFKGYALYKIYGNY